MSSVEDLAVADHPEAAGDVTIIIIEGGKSPRSEGEGDRQLNRYRLLLDVFISFKQKFSRKNVAPY